MNMRKHQQGAALAIGLILLLIITLSGYVSMKGTILQEKMAIGLHNRALSNNGANTALRGGESFLYNLVKQTNGVNIEGTPDGSLFGIYTRYNDTSNPASGMNANYTTFIQDGSGGKEFSADIDLTATGSLNANLAEQPKYMIQELLTSESNGASTQFGGTGGVGGGSSNQQKTYLVTGWSTSGDGKSSSLVQSLYTAVVSSSSQ